MTRKSVDPNMDLMKTKSAQPGPGGKNSATGGRNSADVNPAMDLNKTATPQPGPGGKVAPSGGRSEDVNPKMDLTKVTKVGNEAYMPEVAPAKMPQVGTMPTGKDSAKKVKY